MRPAPRDTEDGSTIPLILGFFVIALLMIAGSIALGQTFVAQRELQDLCDGAAAAAAASSADLDRVEGSVAADSVRFAGVQRGVDAYLERDPDRRDVQVRATLSADQERITLTCERTTPLPIGRVFGLGRVHHTATSTSRAAVVG